MKNISNISNNALRQLDALNKWLSDVYSEETGFDALLLDADFSNLEIEHIKRAHLSEFLQAVINLLASYPDLISEGRNMLMVQHYGLIDGKPLDFYVIAPNYGVCGNRIRRLVNKRLDLYRDPNRQEQFKYDFAAIARRLLYNKSGS